MFFGRNIMLGQGCICTFYYVKSCGMDKVLIICPFYLNLISENDCGYLFDFGVSKNRYSNKNLSFGIVDLGLFPNAAEKFGIPLGRN